MCCMKLEEEIKQTRFDDEFLKAVLNILLTADRISSATNATLKPFGISKEQFNVLRILQGQHAKPISLQQIAERMISKSPNATRLVEKLRSKDLLQRSQCESNRRMVDIVITKKGLALLKEIGPQVKESSNVFRNISDDEALELNRILDKMRTSKEQ